MPIPQYDAYGNSAGFKQDRNGETVLSRLDEGTLQEIAAIGNGRYFRATAGGSELDVLVQDLGRLQQGEIGALKLVEIQCRGWDIINAGIHWINFVVVLTGNEPFEYVMALCESSTRTYRDGMQVETTAVTYAQTVTGIRVVIHTGDETLANREGKATLFRLVGTARRISVYG